MFQQDNTLVISIPHAKTVHLCVFFKAGAASEDMDKKGVAHVCEHMLLQEGQEVNAETLHELMYFGIERLPQDVYTDFSHLLQSLFDTELTTARFEHEKAVITRELTENPPLFAYTKGMELVFGKESPLALPAGGSIESIQSLTLEDVAEYRRLLSPENALFVAVGAVDERAFLQSVEPYVRKKTFSGSVPTAGKNSVTEYIVDQDDELANVHVFIPTVHLSALRERIGLALARTALAGHAFSLLNTALREELEYTYALDTNTSYFTQGGFLHISFTTATQNAEKACDEVDRILHSFSELLTQDLLDRCKKQLCTDALRRTYDAAALAWWHGEDVLLAGETTLYPQGFCDAVESFTLTEVRELAARFFAREYRVTMV